jgi:hypothetical protein
VTREAKIEIARPVPRRTPWSRPTRRAFVGMLAAAAAALAVRARPSELAPEPPQRLWTGKTRWIGHC